MKKFGNVLWGIVLIVIGFGFCCSWGCFWSKCFRYNKY